MTSSTACSSEVWSRRGVLLALALAACARAGPREAPPSLGRLAVFPPDNKSGTPIAQQQLSDVIARSLAARGLEVVAGDALEGFFAKYRIRYTAALDSETSRRIGEELGVDGMVLTTVELNGDAPGPSFGVTMRLVSADARATLRWTDGAARVYNDSPGLLGLGVATTREELERWVLSRMSSSLAAYLSGRGPRSPRCASDKRFRPNVPYRSPRLDAGQRYSVTVLPFENRTKSRQAGELVSLNVLRQLHALDHLQVLEPGVVRDILLRYRIITEGGVSLDQARMLLGGLHTDLVVLGTVFEYDTDGPNSSARVAFSTAVMDTHTGELVAGFSSYHDGDERVVLFDRGRIQTQQELTCRMARDVVDAIFAGSRGAAAVIDPAPRTVNH
jgi:hypothetical protein